MAVEFTDNSARVKAAINDAAIAYLYDAAGELEAQTKRNQEIRVKTGQTKNAWTYTVDESKGEAVIGNPQENAIWEEFGTGEYALNGDGRKGGWWIPLDTGGMTEAQAKAYGFTIREGKNGKKYAFTMGKTPLRPFYKAFTSLKSKLIRRAEQIMKERIGD